jgi:hypothetical protein
MVAWFILICSALRPFNSMCPHMCSKIEIKPYSLASQFGLHILQPTDITPYLKHATFDSPSGHADTVADLSSTQTSATPGMSCEE